METAILIEVVSKICKNLTKQDFITNFELKDEIKKGFSDLTLLPTTNDYYYVKNCIMVFLIEKKEQSFAGQIIYSIDFEKMKKFHFLKNKGEKND
jgi:ribosomal protein S8